MISGFASGVWKIPLILSCARVANLNFKGWRSGAVTELWELSLWPPTLAGKARPGELTLSWITSAKTLDSHWEQAWIAQGQQPQAACSVPEQKPFCS